MKNLLSINILICLISFSKTIYFKKTDKLECFDCSEIASEPAAVCSKNETRTRKAEDNNEYMCRIWAFNDTAIHKALVPVSLCDNETLQTLMDSNFNKNFNSLFEGDLPEAQAYCCNWSFCNYNVTFSQLSESPSCGDTPDCVGATGLKLNYSIILIWLNLTFLIGCFI